MASPSSSARGAICRMAARCVEPSRVLVIFHPRTREADKKIDDLSRAYARQFAQDAVLRADVPNDVRFIQR